MLERLRAEIDRIDDELLELLARRIELAGDIAREKRSRDGDGPVVRPAREAAILRRLVGRAAGRFPADALVRIWRELFAATSRAQRPFAVAVFARTCREYEAVRDHVGSVVPLLRAESCGQAARMWQDGRAEFLALPLDAGTASWWRGLADRPGREPGVAVRLPLFVREGEEPPVLFLLGRVPPEPSGADRSLLMVELDDLLSRAGLLEALARAGAAPRHLALLEEPGRVVHFVEVAGFLAGEEEREAAELLAPVAAHVLRVAVLGAYPEPMRLPAAS